MGNKAPKIPNLIKEAFEKAGQNSIINLCTIIMNY